MLVKNLIEILKTMPDDAVIICGENTITLWVLSKTEDGNACLNMTLIGVRGSPLIDVPIDRDTFIPMDLPEWYEEQIQTKYNQENGE
jgi:hypothetical protein